MDSFIRAYTDVLGKDVLDKIIKRFDEIEQESSHSGEPQFGTKLGRKDSSIMLEDHCSPLSGEIHRAIQPYLQTYLSEFAGGSELPVVGYNVKMQKTEPGGGYHVWHCENGNLSDASRLILVMLYLNDIEEGGETEFLYQSRRVQPKMGRLVFCPTSFTHTHRGNPPLKGNKYMLNGWLQYYHEIS